MKLKKFRIYDKLTKRMYYDVWIERKKDGLWWAYPNGIIKMDSLSKRRFVMENTGIQDVNGKEIFEGDIIKILRAENYGFLQKGKVFDVCWHDEETGFVLGNSKYRLTTNKKVVVVGNIFEAPGTAT